MDRKRPEWLFDESAQVGVDYSDPKLVQQYDQEHGKFRDYRHEAQKIIKTLSLSSTSDVLDIGCGTGGLTTHLAKTCHHVYAADASAQMVTALSGKIEEQQLTNVTPVHAGFLTYEHSGPALDAIIANITLHHLPDFWKQIALCRFHDLLKIGGKLFLADVVFDLDPKGYEQAIDGWLAGMKKLAGDKMAEESVIHVRHEFSTWSWILAGMLERAGFKIEIDEEIMPNMRIYVCSK